MTQSRPASIEIPKNSLPVVVTPKLGRHPQDRWKLAAPYAMGRGARRALRALISLFLPQAPAPSSEDIERRVEHTILTWLPYMHGVSARGLWLAVLLLDWSPVFLFQSFRRLRTLPRKKASELLGQLAHGRFAALRMLVVAVRGITLSAYFDQSEVHAALGYRPVPFLRNRIEERRRLLLRASEGATASHEDLPSAISAIRRVALREVAS